MSALLDITWLFYGLEKFRVAAIRNAILKLLETACIFCFVKAPADWGIYADYVHFRLRRTAYYDAAVIMEIFKKDFSMVKILFANAAANLIVSSLLIPVAGIYGAVIGTIAAESIGLILGLYLCRKYFSVKKIIRNGIPFFIIGFLMSLAVRITAAFTGNTIAGLVIQIAAGVLVYPALSFIYGFFFNPLIKDMIQEFSGRLKKKLEIKEGRRKNDG